jgi:hypothetical protein
MFINKATQNQKNNKSLLLEINKQKQKGITTGRRLEKEEAFYVSLLDNPQGLREQDAAQESL